MLVSVIRKRIFNSLFFSHRTLRQFARKFHSDNGGNVLLIVAISLIVIISGIFLVYNTGNVVTDKMITLNAADASAYSGALWIARGMNVMAVLNMIIAICLILIGILLLGFIILLGLCMATFWMAGGACWAVPPYSASAFPAIASLYEIAETISSIEDVLFGDFPIFEALCLAETFRVGILENEATFVIPVQVIPARHRSSIPDFVQPFILRQPVKKGSLTDLCKYISNIIKEKLFNIASSLDFIPGFEQFINTLKDLIAGTLDTLCKTGDFSTDLEKNDCSDTTIEGCQECARKLIDALEINPSFTYFGWTKWKKGKKDEWELIASSSDDPYKIFPCGDNIYDCNGWYVVSCYYELDTSSVYKKDDSGSGFPFPYMLVDEEFPWYYSVFAFKKPPDKDTFLSLSYRKKDIFKDPKASDYSIAVGQANLVSKGKNARFSPFWMDWNIRLVPFSQPAGVVQKLREVWKSVSKYTGIIEKVLNAVGIKFGINEFADSLFDSIEDLGGLVLH